MTDDDMKMVLARAIEPTNMLVEEVRRMRAILHH